MFTQPTPSSPGLIPSVSSTPPLSSSAPRPSRLRGLSYLRNYTQNHLLSRDSSHHNPSAALQSSQRPEITRSSSYSPTTTSHATSRQSEPPTPSGSTLLPLLRTALTASTHNHPLAHPSAETEPRNGRGRLEPTFETTGSASGGNPALAAQPRSTEDLAAADMTRTRASTTGDNPSEPLPTIRFSAFYDNRASRPSLSFTPISRTLPTGNEVIKVGRYSERENQPPVPANVPSAAPVGFKSKVVSRRHCEFWFEDGKWYIKDVKSSSGTFLNHIRLSPPGAESKPFSLNDGDIVQLGIDFKGGEEMIFRCVKMRVELNRAWQAKPNNFNMAHFRRLRDLATPSPGSENKPVGGDASSQDCSICLNAIAPCQSLFVAPCSHTWHYKCIRELLTGPQYPIFMCPNCRAAADLDAEVDEPSEEWQQMDAVMEGINESPNEDSQVKPRKSREVQDRHLDLGAEPSTRPAVNGGGDGDVTVLLDDMHMADAPAEETHNLSAHTTSNPVPIPPRVSISDDAAQNRPRRTPSPNSHPVLNATEGPITPRNDAGPWVFDGSAGRVSTPAAMNGTMNSIDAAAVGREVNA